MKRYLDEQYSVEALQSAVQSAVNRELTGTEVRYIEWLCRMDYETINIFINLFKDAAKNTGK